MYRLDDPRAKGGRLERSVHEFRVPQGNGVLRLYFDTHKSGVKATVRILDHQKNIVY